MSMKPKLGQIFKDVSEINPPFRLESVILAKIKQEEKKLIREKKFFTLLGLIGSAATAAWAVLVFGQEIWQSDFWSIISLAFSDMSIVAGNWYDYSLSLLETFPALHAAVILAPVFALLLLLNSYLNQINLNIWKHQK